MEAGPSEHALNLLADALDYGPAEREAFVAQASAGNEGLRAEVQSLLAHETGARDFLETPAFALDFEEAGGGIASSELKPGDQLGNCTVLRLLGEGGMSEVYLAQDTRLERLVAVKLLQRHWAGESRPDRFHKERKVLAGLAHANIARLYAAEVTPEGRCCLFMEYVEGERIDRYCDLHELDIVARLALLRKVCAAVAYAHQNLIVHRDLKPANILVDGEGEPKLLDFGIAKLLDPAGDADQTLTRFGALTPEYASPEQLKGEAITTGSDVYSLGVVLYELLTGQRPFAACERRPDLLARAICAEEPVRPSVACAQTANPGAPAIAGISADKLRRTLAGDLDNIAAKALRQEPARRYASVAQFAEDLRRYCDGLPVTACPDTFVYRTGKFAWRNRLVVAIAALLALSLVAGLITTAWEARRASRRFEDVRRLAKSILFEVEPLMANTSGSTAARALLTRRALEYLDSLSLEAGGNRELRQELAASYERVGDVQGNPAGANLGDLKAGLKSYRKARVLRLTLAAPAPQDPWARHELANNEEQTATMLWWNNDTPGALADYRDALALRRQLLVEQPHSVDFRRGFASLEMRLADVDTWNGQNARALDELRQALPVLQNLAAERPGDASVQIDLARSLARLGVAQRETGAYASALASLHQAQAIIEPVTRRDPGNRTALLQYCYELTIEDETYAGRGTPEATEEALILIPRLISATERLVKQDPQDATVRHNLSIAYGDYGTALSRAGRWQEALDQLQKGSAINAQLALQAPDNGGYLHFGGELQTGLGEARWHLGELGEALANEVTAQRSLEAAAAKDPANDRVKRDLVTALILQGRIEQQRAQPTEARHCFTQALKGLNALIAKKFTGQNDAADAEFLRGVLVGATL
jgi:tetratricopeptide (TPR) repeat protein